MAKTSKFKQYWLEREEGGLTSGGVNQMIQAAMNGHQNRIRVGRSSFGANFEVTSDGTATAAALNQVNKITAGMDFTGREGQPVYIASNGLAYVAHALDSSITSRYAGIVLRGAASGELILVQNTGINTKLTGLTAGSQYYLQDPATDQSQGTNNQDNTLYGANWQAQTFAAGGNFTIIGASVVLKKSNTPSGNVVVGVRATSGGEPTGSDLASGTVPCADVTGSYVEYDFLFTAPYALTSGTIYSLVVRAPDATAINSLDIGGSSTSTYGSGTQYLSTNSGSTWSDQSRDLYFKTKHADGSLGTSAGTVSKVMGTATSATSLNLAV